MRSTCVRVDASSSSRYGSSSSVEMTSTQASPMQPGLGTTVHSLPSQVLDLIAASLIGGHRQNFKGACKCFSLAISQQTRTVDLSGLCGWGNSSQFVHQAAFQALTQYTGVRHIRLPHGWRQEEILSLLNHTEVCRKHWRQLLSLSLHFQAFIPGLAAALHQIAPNLTTLKLSVDPAFETTSRQAWRASSLLQLTQLKSVIIEADLRAEALQVLSGLPRLVDLQLAGSSTSGHSAADLAALFSLTGLSSLRFNWQAGRTLTDVSQVNNLSSNLKDLQIWISAGHHLPPCSSKPLTGLMTAIGTLSQLTSLQLLQGLYMSWDLRMIVHLGQLTQLQVLGLHDSVLSEFELALLSPCTALTALKVDSIKLNSLQRSSQAAATTQEEAEFTAGLAAFMVAATEARVFGPGVSSRTVPHLITLQRLQHLEVNMLQLGVWQLHEVCPDLNTLTPLECTLGSKGRGVVWDLGCLADHRKLQSLGLMLGALGTAGMRYNKDAATSRDAESAAAVAATAVVRAIMQSAGVRRLSGAVSRCSMQELVTVLKSLPSLRCLQLWGHAGGVSDRFVASVDGAASTCCSNGGCHYINDPHSSSSCSRSESRCRSRCSAHGEASNSSSSSSLTATSRLSLSTDECSIKDGTSSGSSSNCSSPGKSAAMVVGNLLHSLGSLVSPRSRDSMRAATQAATTLTAAAAKSAAASHGALEGGQHFLSSQIPSDVTGSKHQQLKQQNESQAAEESGADSACSAASATVDTAEQIMAAVASTPGATTAERALCCSSGVTCSRCCHHGADHQLVQQLLQDFPQLEQIQLVKCQHLAQGGMQLAAQCCSMTSTAVVSVLER